jgi:hypothetical protein
MKERASGARAGTRERPISHFMKPPVAVELLRLRHGEANAREIAGQEQQRAKRARSKRRFEFWSEVAAQLSAAATTAARGLEP